MPGAPLSCTLQENYKDEGWKGLDLKAIASQHGLLGKSHRSHDVKALVCVPFVFEQVKHTNSAGGWGLEQETFFPSVQRVWNTYIEYE